MAIFQITPLIQDNGSLAAKISAELPESNVYRLKNAGWLAKFDGTSKELSKVIGLEGDSPTSKSCLVISVSGYWGLASPDLWEWLKSHWS